MTVETLTAATADAVWECLARQVHAGRLIEVPVEHALGAVLAADVRAAHDFPPFDRAVMDGYAVRTADFSDGRAVLRCTGLVRAGAAELPEVAPGTCVQINTGAALPSGADAVVMVEHSRRLGDERVELRDHPTPGQSIERRGALAPREGLLVRAGARVGPGTLAALVAGGVQRVSIFAHPRVAILSTGDEIVANRETLRPGQIHDSNGVMLETLVRRAGGEPVRLGRLPDEPGPLRAALELGLNEDVLCVIGGMSKGTHDLIPGLLEQLGVGWLVSSLNLKPGKPTRIGRSDGCWVIGLPGNPVSCAVCFLLFARAILEGLQGLGVRRPPHALARLDAEMPANGARPLYQPAEWYIDQHGQPRVCPVLWRGSGDPFGMAVANALIYRPANAAPAPADDAAQFVPLDLPR